jgi:2-oxoglutarate ferredoxin oxidoreductase subunit alpha
MQTLRDNLPEPEHYGAKDAKTVFVSYGSAGNPIKDILEHRADIGYLQYKYIYPLKYEKLLELNEKGIRLVLIENNQTGEFGKLIKQESGLEINERLLKYNGRPFFVEDILDYLKE